MPHRIKKSKKLGLPPGVSRYAGDIEEMEIKIEIINYQYRNEINEIQQEMIDKEHILEKLNQINDQSITWIDIQGIHDENLILILQLISIFILY